MDDSLVSSFESLDELEQLRKENSKLKYRRDFLQNALKDSGGCNGSVVPDNILNVKEHLLSLFDSSIKSAYPDLQDCPAIVMPSKKDVGYQVNSVMKIIKVMKEKGENLNPKTVAEKLIQHVPNSPAIERLEASNAGFINIALSKNFITKQLQNMLVNGIQAESKVRQKIIIDYSSPNIAKEMHVGHLRTTIIGDCLANILEFLGHDVLRINHVGDWGTQFGMLIAHLVEKFPDCLTAPPPIGDLQVFYKEAKKRFDMEDDFKKRAYACVVKLQSKDKDMIEAWKLICDVSRKEFQQIYDMLGISGLVERGESFYHDLMGEVVSDCESRNLLKEEEGRKLFYSEKTEVPLTVVKSDGGFTYDTSDLACIKHRAQVDKADRIIYVVDSGQALHLQSIYACAEIAGYYDPKKCRVEHVGFGVVLGEDKKKFKTRSGETVRLKDLLLEGLERAEKKLIEKGRDQELSPEELKQAREAVAIGCIKYADLSHDRKLDYEFSFDRMLDYRGNTAVYLLYTLTRIRSIKRTANIEEPTEKMAGRIEIKLEHEREIKLANYLIRFHEVIAQVAEELFPHVLCSYLYDISVVYSEFYDKCYCIEKYVENGEAKTKVNLSRILLCEATAAVLEKGLSLLGIRTLSKM